MNDDVTVSVAVVTSMHLLHCWAVETGGSANQIAHRIDWCTERGGPSGMVGAGPFETVLQGDSWLGDPKIRYKKK